MEKTKPCKRCGCLITYKSKTKEYCDPCRKIVSNENKRDFKRRANAVTRKRKFILPGEELERQELLEMSEEERQHRRHRLSRGFEDILDRYKARHKNDYKQMLELAKA
jgi:hypothetical protein